MCGRVPVITVFEGEVDGGGCCAVEVGVASPRDSGGGGGEDASSTSCRSMVMMSCCPASLEIYRAALLRFIKTPHV